MTLVSRERLFATPLHLHQGDARQPLGIMPRRDGDHFVATYDPERASLDAAAMLARVRLSSEGIAVSEVILVDHDPDLTALYHAASKLLLDVEVTSGPRITEPVVKVISQDPTQAVYVIPEDWDLSDALDRLPIAFATARPEIARYLERIEQAKKDTEGKIDEALDMVTALILETDDPRGVLDEVVRICRQVRTDRSAGGAPAEAA
ncbi:MULTISPECIES: hypothetical protein [unclassified Streptomyces]|uniref:hypothetical protein n=1 Tax=unclassified Streptomyces TaxID=2593676 RepID=UPI00093DC98D|nr:hypothetical protein [Streptomyces sp. CB02400]OKK09945.1 hypothetical protein AMK33_13300 [Streptomyces sp. CB02400]